MRPGRRLYPTYSMHFQTVLLDLMFENYSESQWIEAVGSDWFAWVVENRSNDDTLLELLQVFPDLLDFVVDPWHQECGQLVQKR